ncbi:MAG: iron-sulfur cluster repair di-iron protein [Acidobacteria bacterium]|nr:MAG: iron-sulfur cluster repair di-iron protein [Acidobacteriota bacterium]REJ99022.1 MAG: iron-sulfur cluster repair di-iron protein [Acidobacteriota bacterium]REK16257.1 MAG: iron-sulfur cluster repair di-iron protein [Acidobacteriota bacterium]REK43938.1 MAG: iron-sulfur cluster repair di-iron protein [Acidobacteriota bacterium]
MQNIELKTVREIALEMPLSTRVFEEFRIDYCCGGKKPFREACSDAGVSAELVANKLEEAFAADNTEQQIDYWKMPLDDLVSHILGTHHVFTKSEITLLGPLMEKVASRHGETHGELFMLKSYVLTLFGDLASHMAKEEAILFPYVRDLARRNGEVSSSSPAFGTVYNPVRIMMAEHDRAGDLLRNMRKVTNGYELPEGACPSYTALYNRLEALEEDLHQHIHLENNVLFPKAIELEKQIFPLAVG